MTRPSSLTSMTSRVGAGSSASSISVHEHEPAHVPQMLYHTPLYHHGRGPPPVEVRMPLPTPGHHWSQPNHPLLHSSRHGRSFVVQRPNLCPVAIQRTSAAI